MKALNLAVLSIEHFKEIRRWRDEQRDILRTKVDMEPRDYRRLLIDDECKRYANENHLYGISHLGRFIAFGGLTHIKWANDHATSAELSFICGYPELYEAAFRFHLAVSSDMWFSDSYYGGEVLISETYPHRERHMRIMEECGFRIKSICHRLTKENYVG